MTNTDTTKKINRYTILDTEIKRISRDLKDAKKVMEAKIREAINSYRDYRKTVYKPAREAAFHAFANARVNKMKTVKKNDSTKIAAKVDEVAAPVVK